MIEVRVPDEELVSRIEKRAGAKTGGARARRFNAGDAEEASRDVYHSQTAPVLPYYQDKGMLKTVDGLQAIEAVTAEIMSILEGLMNVSTRG